MLEGSEAVSVALMQERCYQCMQPVRVDAEEYALLVFSKRGVGLLIRHLLSCRRWDPQPLKSAVIWKAAESRVRAVGADHRRLFICSYGF
jgi:hypothetical protein